MSDKVGQSRKLDEQSLPLQHMLQEEIDCSSSNKLSLSQMTDIVYSQDDTFSIGRGLSQFENLNDDITSDTQQPNCESTYTKDEIKIMMQGFKHDNVSSHIFLKTAKGTPHEWEHIPRKYFYIKLLKPVLTELTNPNSNLSITNAYIQIIDKYKSITGTDHTPPFFSLDKRRNIYVRMSDKEVQLYIKTLLEKMDRVLKTIQKYEEAPCVNLKRLMDKQNKVSFLLLIYLIGIFLITTV